MAIKRKHPQPGKWQKIVYAKNVYDTLMPLYKISKIMGLSPYAYKEKQGKHQFVICKWGSSYSILFILFYIAFFSYASSDHNKATLVSTNTTSKVAHFIDTFQWYASISAMIGLVFANCCHQKILLKAVGELVSIDNQIENYGLKINHYQAKKEVIFTVIWQITAFVIMECLNCSLFLTEMRITSVICYILCYIPLLISGLLKSQFVVLVALLRYRFETINAKLRTITRSTKSPSTKIHPLQNIIPANPSQQIVVTIRKLHGQLCNVGRHINKAFSLQILCIIGYNFISFTAHAYFCMESYITIYVENESISFGLITTSMWAVVKLSVLLHLTYACTITKNEAVESGVIIHKIQNRYQRPTLDEIVAFSKQILHWDFKFTAYDLFELDMSTFYLMVTSSTTYLIILIQMDMAVNMNHSFLYKNITFGKISP